MQKITTQKVNSCDISLCTFINIGHSRNTVAIKLSDYILKATNRNEIILAVIANYSKAFDTRDYKILITKLYRLNFSRQALQLMVGYLYNRRAIRTGLSKILRPTFRFSTMEFFNTGNNLFCLNLCIRHEPQHSRKQFAVC